MGSDLVIPAFVDALSVDRNVKMRRGRPMWIRLDIVVPRIGLVLVKNIPRPRFGYRRAKLILGPAIDRKLEGAGGLRRIRRFGEVGETDLLSWS